MVTLIILIYAGYLIAVGVQGNSTKLVNMLQSEGGFVAWIAVILIVTMLGSLWNKKVANAFMVLVVISFLLYEKNQETFYGELSKVYHHFLGK